MSDTRRKGREGSRKSPGSLSAPLELAAGFIRERAVRPLRRRPKPFALCLYVTYKCNLRCAMCGIWRHKDPGPELSLEGFERVLSDPLFAGIRFVNLNGGEPNLRPDLAGIAAMLVRKFRLRALTLNTNGLPPRTTESNARAIAGVCAEAGVPFSISVSLHGLDGVHDSLSGLKGGFKRVGETLDRLQKLQAATPFFLGINCVITRTNAGELEAFHEWCRGRNLPANYTLGEVRDRFYNSENRSRVELGPAERAPVVAFLRRRAGEKSLRNHHALRYADLADMIENDGRRRLSCHYAMGGVILGARGQLYYCKQSRDIGDCRTASARELYFREDNIGYRSKELFAGVCPHCPPNTFNRFELEHDLFRYARFLLGSRRGVPVSRD